MDRPPEACVRRQGGVPVWWYGLRLGTSQPRVQVTLEPEVGEALAAIESRPRSKSRLIRELTRHGARAVEDERRRREEAQESLARVARGEVGLDLDAAGALHEDRGEQLP